MTCCGGFWLRTFNSTKNSIPLQLPLPALLRFMFSYQRDRDRYSCIMTRTKIVKRKSIRAYFTGYEFSEVYRTTINCTFINIVLKATSHSILIQKDRKTVSLKARLIYTRKRFSLVSTSFWNLLWYKNPLKLGHLAP